MPRILRQSLLDKEQALRQASSDAVNEDTNTVNDTVEYCQRCSKILSMRDRIAYEDSDMADRQFQ